MIKRFDLVKIKTAKNVRWVSGPSGRADRPDGVWTVIAGSYGQLVLVAKGETVAMVPEEDLYKVADYDLPNVLEKIEAIRPGRGIDDGKERQQEPEQGSAGPESGPE